MRDLVTSFKSASVWLMLLLASWRLFLQRACSSSAPGLLSSSGHVSAGPIATCSLPLVAVP
jgi:hypothetical protein